MQPNSREAERNKRDRINPVALFAILIRLYVAECYGANEYSNPTNKKKRTCSSECA